MNLNSFNTAKLMRLALLGTAMLGLAACQDGDGRLGNARAYAPLPPETLALMEEKGTNKGAPMLIRTFKKEAEFEIWKMKGDGHYTLLKTFPMCRWSGQLGPKTREGDRQVPEGFYQISPGQMNPNSNYYLSFNVGYPNAYDKAWGRGGGLIMVHGACSSAGCFSMTDKQIAEIYTIARESFSGGQRAIQMESLPFRMTAENLAKHRLDPNINFWKQLKDGSDHFEVSKLEPKVGVCNRRYVFDAQAANPAQSLDPAGICPPLREDDEIKRGVLAKQSKDNEAVAELVAKGVKPVRVLYADGGQHPEFASLTSDVSRPDALASGPVEVALGEPGGKKSPLVQVASTKTERQANEAARTATAIAAPTIEVAKGSEVAKRSEVAKAATVANAGSPKGGLTTMSARVRPGVAAPDTSMAAVAPAAAEAEVAQPFYKRWLGFAPSETASAPLPAREPAAPELANVPLPPRR